MHFLALRGIGRHAARFRSLFDAARASLVYFNQGHAQTRRQFEPHPGPVQRCADSLHANYALQYARGKGSLTK